MTDLPEFEVTSDPPVCVDGVNAQQAADERVRLDLENPCDGEEDGSAPLLYVRPAYSNDPWEPVHPRYPAEWLGGTP